MLTIRSLGSCFGRAAVDTIMHDGIEHAGYLAFLGLLALFPFLVFVFSIVGVMGAGAQGGEIIALVFSNLPPDLVAALKPRINEIISGPPQGLITVAILGAIWTASSAVEGVRTVLNRAYRVATPPAYPLRRMLSILQLLVFTFIVTACLLLLVVVPVILHQLQGVLGITELESGKERWNNFFVVVTILVLFVGVAWIYYVVPNIRQSMISVAPGASIVVLLWMLAANLLSAYLSHFQQVNLIYGSLGGIIAALVFFYISNIIFIFGAEFNYYFNQAVGLRMQAKENADGTPAAGAGPPA